MSVRFGSFSRKPSSHLPCEEHQHARHAQARNQQDTITMVRFRDCRVTTAPAATATSSNSKQNAPQLQDGANSNRHVGNTPSSSTSAAAAAATTTAATATKRNRSNNSDNNNNDDDDDNDEKASPPTDPLTKYTCTRVLVHYITIAPSLRRRPLRLRWCAKNATAIRPQGQRLLAQLHRHHQSSLHQQHHQHHFTFTTTPTTISVITIDTGADVRAGESTRVRGTFVRENAVITELLTLFHEKHTNNPTTTCVFDNVLFRFRTQSIADASAVAISSTSLAGSLLVPRNARMAANRALTAATGLFHDDSPEIRFQ
jgi:hypothetical protein